MELGALKSLLTTVLLPPMSLMLLAFFGLVLAARRKRAGLLLSAVALVMLWLLGCQGTAVWLARTALPQYPPVTLAQLKANQVQAIVVLGGGINPLAPEYGQAQPGPATAARLRYGVWLAKQSGLPVAFTGGSGWAADSTTPGTQPATEAAVAARIAEQDYGIKLRWLESQSRDTSENARLLAPMLKRDGIARIALVTDAMHMPRSVGEFERTGLTITPAPTGYVLPTKTWLLQWLPSSEGLYSSTRLMHELLGLTAAKLR